MRMVANDTRLVPVVNEPANWKVSQGCLAVTTDQKTDFWQKTHYGFARDSGHFLGVSVSEEFTARVRVQGVPIPV